MPTKLQYSPHPAPTIVYGKKVQQAITDTSPILDKDSNNLVRSIVGVVLFIGQFIDMTLLISCNEIVLQQTDATMKTLNLYISLLDYMSTYPDLFITFKRLDMIFQVLSDSSYQSISKSRSRVGGYHYLGNKCNPNVDILF